MDYPHYYFTWGLICIGWVVAIITAYWISCRNSRVNEIAARKKSIADYTDQIISLSISYWGKAELLNDTSILNKLDLISSEMNGFKKSKQKSAAILTYIKFKQAITSDDRFKSNGFTADESTKSILNNITGRSVEFRNAIKKIPSS